MLMPSRWALAAAALSLCGCGRSRHERVQTYAAPPLPAGFVERSADGWRINIPATWLNASRPAPVTWAVADPQLAEDFHANASVAAEKFAGASYDYAETNEAALRREPRARVEAVREEVIDGDQTLLIESRWAPAAPSTTAFHSLQSALSARGSGYVVTCSAAASAFERYRSTCESIVRSFAVER